MVLIKYKKKWYGHDAKLRCQPFRINMVTQPFFSFFFMPVQHGEEAAHYTRTTKASVNTYWKGSISTRTEGQDLPGR